MFAGTSTRFTYSCSGPCHPHDRCSCWWQLAGGHAAQCCGGVEAGGTAGGCSVAASDGGGGGNNPCLTAASLRFIARQSHWFASLLCGATVVFIAATQHQTSCVIRLVSARVQVALHASSKWSDCALLTTTGSCCVSHCPTPPFVACRQPIQASFAVTVMVWHTAAGQAVAEAAVTSGPVVAGAAAGAAGLAGTAMAATVSRGQQSCTQATTAAAAAVAAWGLCHSPGLSTAGLLAV
jgi:hypothetical protein